MPEASACAAPRRTALLCLLALALLAAGMTNCWRIQPDSALYIGIAKSLAAGKGYTFSGRVQYSIPPVAPFYYSLAFSSGRLPAGPALARRFLWPNVLSSVVTLSGFVAAILLLREVSPGGMTAALLMLVLSNRYYSTSLVPLTDGLYCLVSWAALAAFLRFRKQGRWLPGLLSALAVALAPLTRAVGIPLVIAAVIHLFPKNPAAPSAPGRVSRLLAALPGIVTAFAVAFVVMTHRGTRDFNYVDDLFSGRSAFDVAARFASNLTTVPGGIFEALVGLESVAGLSLLLFALIVIGAVRLWRSGKGVIVTYLAIYVVWVAAGERMLPRYVTPLLPLVYACVIDAVSWVIDVLAPWSAGGARVARAVLVAVLAVNAAYIGREILRTRHGDFYSTYRHGDYVDYLALCDALYANPPNGRIMVRQERLICVLTGLDTVQLPYTVELPRRTDVKEIGEFVLSRNVAALVIDPQDADDTSLLSRFVEASPEWREKGRFGRLILYRSSVPPRPHPVVVARPDQSGRPLPLAPPGEFPLSRRERVRVRENASWPASAAGA